MPVFWSVDGGSFMIAVVPLRYAVALFLTLVTGVGVWTWFSTRESQTDGKTEIVIWNVGSYGDDVYTAFHDFEQQNPQYKVVASAAAAQDFTGDAQRLICAIAGDVPPDVVYFDRFAIGEWASRGALTDMQPMVDAQTANDPYRLDLKEYYPWAVAEASYRKPGTTAAPGLFGIPTGTDIRVLFCNSDHLRQAGYVDADGNPRPPQNWDELRAYSKKLSHIDDRGMITRLGFSPSWGNSWLYLYSFQAGGNMLSPDGTRVTMDTPPVRRALRFMMDAYDDNGGVKAVNAFQSSFQSGALDPFLTGQVSMKIDGDWCMVNAADWRRDMEFTVTPAPMPADRLAAGVKPVTWSGGYSLVIPSTSRHKDGAFKLIQFLSSRKTYRFLEQGRREVAQSEGKIYFPHITANRKQYEEILADTVANDRTMPASMRRGLEVVRDLLPQTQIRPVSPIGQLVWSQHVRACDQAVNHVFAGQVKDKDEEVRTSLASMQVEPQQRLDEILAPPPPGVVRWTPYFFGYAALILCAGALVWVAFLKNRRTHDYRAGELGAAVMFVSPWLVGMIVFTGGPILFSLVFAFTRYDTFNPARYVGGENFAKVFHDPIFYKALGNTAYMLVRIPLTMAVSLGIAMLLNRQIRGIGSYRTAFYMPTIVPLVASSILWILLLNPNVGLVNQGIDWVIGTPPAHWIEWGINHVHTFAEGPFRFTPPTWLSDARWSKPSLILMALWSAGGGMIIWLAGLQSIPKQLYEAATVDGAGPWRQFVNVTLPMLSPYILFNLIMGVIGTMQVFGEAFIMTQGGPADSTLFYAYHLFKQAFQFFQMGYASALAWILFLIVLSLTLVQLYLSKKWVTYDQT